MLGNAHGVVHVVKYLGQFCLVRRQQFWDFGDHVLYFTLAEAELELINLKTVRQNVGIQTRCGIND